MPPPGRKPNISKLEAKKAALNAQIKALKREERREQLALERKRYAILGRALAKELAENEQLAAQLEPVLNSRVTKAPERALLGLSPLSDEAPSEPGQ